MIGGLELGSFSLIFTILCVYFLINASNYLDGLDGVLATNFLISLCSLFVFNKNLYFDFSNFIFFISIPVFIFLLFNLSIFKFTKMFLGDSGSFLIGYTLSFTMILAYKEYGVDISLIVWSLSFLVYEFLCVNLIRLFNKKPLFKASRDHIHHLIFKKNNSIKKNEHLFNLHTIVSDFLWIFNF